jgi:hypothetical protein
MLSEEMMVVFDGVDIIFGVCDGVMLAGKIVLLKSKKTKKYNMQKLNLNA